MTNDPVGELMRGVLRWRQLSPCPCTGQNAWLTAADLRQSVQSADAYPDCSWQLLFSGVPASKVDVIPSSADLFRLSTSKHESAVRVTDG
eukprot:53252-Eustigmatos_ZCMA.PRE.1